MKSLSTNLTEASRRLVVWASVFTMAAVVLLPTTANAAQLTNRKSTPSTSAAGATAVTYTSVLTLGTSGQTLGAILVQICDSPLSTAACVNTAGSLGVTMAGASSATVSGQSGGTFTIGAVTANSVLIPAGTPTAQTGTPTLTITIANITNPTTANSTYYVRVSTYTNVAGTTPAYPGTDFGAMALSTTQSITVAANVQESLTFCTGTNAATATSCGNISGSLVNIGTGTDNVLSTSPSGAVSIMYASTNGATGYAITYFAGNFNSSNDTIASNGAASAALPATGTASFGINLATNTTPTVTNSSGATGTGTGTVNANYTTANQYAFVPSTATTVGSAAGPTLANRFTVSYVAQAGSLTKPGAFSTVFNYVATATF